MRKGTSLDNLPSDRFIVTPQFKKEWTKSGYTKNCYRLLELKLIDSPETGNTVDGMVPNLRLMNWKNYNKKGEDKNVVIIYIYIDKDTPIFLMNVLEDGDDLKQIMLDPDKLSRYLENIMQIIETMFKLVT